MSAAGEQNRRHAGEVRQEVLKGSLRSTSALQEQLRCWYAAGGASQRQVQEKVHLLRELDTLRLKSQEARDASLISDILSAGDEPFTLVYRHHK